MARRELGSGEVAPVSEVIKKRLLVALLAAFAIWPVFQGIGVRATDMQPRMLGGWAQHAKPWIAPRIVLWRRDAAGVWRPLTGQELNDRARIAMIGFMGQLTSYPRGVSPRLIAPVLLAEVPAAAAVKIDLQHFAFGRSEVVDGVIIRLECRSLRERKRDE